jgi:hypothetical protein
MKCIESMKQAEQPKLLKYITVWTQKKKKVYDPNFMEIIQKEITNGLCV